MKILGLIPARGGSKRVPMKNLRTLGDKTLIEWAINSAKGLPEICDLLLSTDSNEIAKVGFQQDILVPWLRPQEYANDDSSSADVAIHALDWYETHYGDVDGLLLLQPSSPFRARQSIIDSLKKYKEGSGRSVISVSECRDHPMWAMTIDNGYMRPFLDDYRPGLRSQELPKAYVPNGAIYLVEPKVLRKKRSFASGEIIPMIINSIKESIDIDTEDDLLFAKFLLENGGNENC
jgi:CMP-N,N'-diacetyllegionaminic acid synthase